MIVAGIDEAGLGPVLGPLVVTATAFEFADGGAEADMWQLLAPAVRRKPSRRGGGIAIGDSKRLYSRKSKAGLEHLERAVMSVLGAADRRPKSLRELLAIVAPATGGKLGLYPWYDQAQLELPHKISSDNAAFSANALAAAMDRVGVSLATVRSEPVLVDEFNRIARATRNKSRLLFGVTSRLIRHLWDRTDREARVFVDRQGGRIRYLPGLEQCMAECSFKVLQEDQDASAYVLTSGAKRMELTFMKGTEDQHLPVALASMASKYIRELFMLVFNRFWQPHVPDLAPTAGYYTDGRRFFGEIQPAMKRLGLTEDLLYRIC